MTILKKMLKNDDVSANQAKTHIYKDKIVFLSYFALIFRD